ncbi:MAG: type II secretion system GspH family protein [Deltaproteobacteria bacterium]|nr:type II secretion system GspH family protein [Deltaproteobacteria bacterium]
MRKNNSASGFSLIEVIVAFVLVSIVAVMLFTFFGTSITQSSIPIFRLNATGKLNAIMERITAEYETIPRWSPNKSYALGDVVIPTSTPTKRNGYKYIVKTAGTSASAIKDEPSWPDSGDVADGTGTLVWTQNGAAPTLSELQTSINAHTADTHFGGGYRVIDNRFITFDLTHAKTALDPAPEVASGTATDYLKVTIGLPTGSATDETLTTLFVTR